MGPDVVAKAFDTAKAAIAKGGKPATVKLKVKFDRPKMNAVRKRANKMTMADKNGVTR